MAALVAPTEGGGHRDPGAAAAGGDGEEKDEGAEESLSSPRRPRDVLEGDGRSEQKRLSLRPCLGSGASAEPSCAARTHDSKWQRLSHTGTALPALRRRALPARTKRSGARSGAQAAALRAVRLGSGAASHGRSSEGSAAAAAAAAQPLFLRAVTTPRSRVPPPCPFPPPALTVAPLSLPPGAT